MRAQLRLYKVKPGEMAAFLAAWENHAVPVRQLYGFRVLAAWRSEDESSFGWLVTHDGAGDFETAEQAYYSSPERAAMADDPAVYLESVATQMVTVL